MQSHSTDPLDAGASAAFTSADPAIHDALALMDGGRFDVAESVARGGSSQEHSEVLDIIRRLRWEYSLHESALLEKLRQSIPDVTSADLARWRAAGQVQF